MSWRDCVALVTGASSGIGRAVAQRLARLGARVALTSRRAEALAELARETGGLALPADITDEQAVRQVVASTVGHFGKLSLLVCSAGVSMRSWFAETSIAAMERVMKVNYGGVLRATHAALPHIQAAKGSLVAISSLVGKRGTPTYAAYSASKFAVQGLYESLRMELAPHGVHVGIVSPGHVDTPLREKVLGPDGEPYPEPVLPPFRVWPLDLLVDRVIKLIERRRAEALLPGFVGPLLALDQILGPWLGDRVVRKRIDAAPLPRRI
jgi:NAD(P)-dependent dehydrogenase (short-subunit alcohol dehydrogenase family)